MEPVAEVSNRSELPEQAQNKSAKIDKIAIFFIKRGILTAKLQKKYGFCKKK
jgi:hypothetical protein